MNLTFFSLNRIAFFCAVAASLSGCSNPLGNTSIAENTFHPGYSPPPEQTTTPTPTASPGSVDHFELSGLTSPVEAGSSQSLTITAKDSTNTTITSYAGTVTLSSSDGAAVLGASSTLSSGVGTFSVVLKTKGTRSITASDGSVTSSQSGIVVNASTYDVTQSVVTVSAATLTSGSTLTATLTTKDSYGNTNPSGLPALGSIAFTSSVVGGTGTFSAVSAAGSGVFTSTFTGVLAGSVTIGATLSSVAVSTNASVTINPSATIASIAFTTQPSTAADADTALASQPVVKVYDAQGNIITSNHSASITLSAHATADCSDSAITGGISATANPVTSSSGVATFANVKLLKTSAIRIKATDGTRSVCSNANITVDPGAIASIAFTTQPAPANRTADEAFTTQPVVTGYDANSNVVTDDNSTIITLTGSSSSTCSGGTVASSIAATANPVTFVNGVATFAAVQIQKMSVVRIQASDGTHTACSNALTITGGAATSATLTSVYPTSIAADGSTLSTFTANAKDQFDNPSPGAAMTLTSSRGATDTITTSPATTDASGNASISVKSSTTGNPTLTVTLAGSTWTRKILFLSQTPTIDYQARYAELGTTSGTTTTTSWWKDLYQSITTNDFQLFNFLNPNTSWLGNGGSAAATDPYRLNFTAASSQYLKTTTTLNSGNDAYFETWVKPSSAASKGTVILSNADTSNKGIILQQSKLEAGKFEVKLGTSKSYSEEVLADSPTAFWPLDQVKGKTVFEAVTGTYVGSSELGVTFGSPTTGPTSDTQQSASFTSSGNQIDFGNFAAGNFGTSSFSIEFWVNTTDTNGFIVVKSRCDGTAGRWGIGLGQVGSAAANGKLYFIIHSSSAQLTGLISGPINDGQWHHVVVTADRAGSATSYIDGVASGVSLSIATANTTISSTNSLVFGNYNNGNVSTPTGTGGALGASTCFTNTAAQTSLIGKLSNMAFYTGVLTPTRISAHYDARTRPLCRSQTSFANGVWNFISTLFNSSTGAFKLFVNGSEECSTTLASPSALYTGSSSPLAAAAAVDNSNAITAGSYWSGDLGEMRASNTAPSTNSNVVDHYNAEKSNYPQFSPSDISGQVLWLDSNDASTLFVNNDCTTTAVTANGDKVGCWKDKSTAANHMIQATDTKKPTYATNSYNNLPALRFAETASQYMASVAGGFVGPITLYAVTRNGSCVPSAGACTFGIVQFGSESAGSKRRLVGIYNSGSYLFALNLWGATATTTTSASTTPTIFGSTMSNTGAANLFSNGKLNTSANLTTIASLTTPAPIEIGRAQSGGSAQYYLTGDIMEILIYNSVISENDRKKIEAYLNAKYKAY